MLHSKLQGDVADFATERLVGAACELVRTCSEVCASTGTPDLLPRFMPCIQLVLRNGTAAQQFLMWLFQQGVLDDDCLVGSVGAQVRALDSWLLLVRTSTASPALAEECTPPVLLHQWLRQLLQIMHALEPTVWKPGARQTH